MSVGRVLEACASAAPTYRELGAALTSTLPSGFHHQCVEIDVGAGRATFDRAVAGLRAWEAHHVVGLRVLPPGASVVPGATVLVAVGTRSFAVAAPCRIVAVLDEADRWGFAYGTLPGHPECGEEAFVVSLTERGRVRFGVTSFSRPAGTLTRLAGPLARLVQRLATRSYLHALRRSTAMH